MARRRLTVFEADVVDDLLLVDRRPVAAELSVPRDLPPVVRKRIESNVVHSQVHPVPGGSARFVARRIPGRDGLRWWARLDDGVRDTAEVRAAVAARAIRSPPSTRRVELSASALHWGSNRTHRTPSRRRPAAPGG